jgi:hypothetical protein
MRNIVTILETLILMLCFGINAQAASRVKLGDVGDDNPHYLWCLKNHHKVIPGESFVVTFRGQSLIDSNINGEIDLTSTSRDHFKWHDISYPNRPYMTFTPTMGVLSGLSLAIEPLSNTPPDLYYIKFIGIDDRNEETESTQGCLVEVVNQHPDIEVTDLRLDTSSADSFKVRMTIRNNTTVPLVSVPWSIDVYPINMQGRSIGIRAERHISGIQNNVGPLTTFEVMVPTVSGYNNFYRLIGRADPDNFIGENEEDRGNNEETKLIHAPPPPVPPRLVTQDLRYSFAQANGANFSNNIDGNAFCIHIGVGDWEDTQWAFPSTNLKRGVLFQADCQVSGGKANPEAFKDFYLKNGWYVKSVGEPEIIRQSSTRWTPRGNVETSGFELTTRPVIGSNNPYMKAHIWADPGAFIGVGVRVTIEGPEETDPYRDACDDNCEIVNSLCVKRIVGDEWNCGGDLDCGSQYTCIDGKCRQVCGAP